MSVGKRGYLSRLQIIWIFLNFDRHGQHEVGNIGILVLWRDHEKLSKFVCALSLGTGPMKFATLKCNPIKSTDIYFHIY